MKFIGSKIQIWLFLSIIFIQINPSHAQSFKLATWNLEWLTSSSISAAKGTPRTASDIQRLSDYFALMDADVVTFQEVNDKAIMQTIAGDNYTIVLSSRSKDQFHRQQFATINQYTGFAIRKELNFKRQQDVTFRTTQPNKLRFATWITLSLDDKPHQSLHLLSVHLKAGCPTRFNAKQRSCQILKKQALELQQWIKLKQQRQQDYIIVGDFNHQLAFHGDWLWKILHTNTKPSKLITRSTAPRCQVRAPKKHSASKPTITYRFLIDHMVASTSVVNHQAQQLRFKPQDVLRYQLSDHCPITAYIGSAQP